ncbi:MAG: hypothetical protein WC171_01500 [Bacteroidales bacterium]|jgi:hypothetical protein
MQLNGTERKKGNRTKTRELAPKAKGEPRTRGGRGPVAERQRSDSGAVAQQPGGVPRSFGAAT